MWICESSRPIQIVADRGFLCIMKVGRPDLWIPSPTTVSRGIHERMDDAKKNMVEFLKVMPHVCTFFNTAG